MSNTTEQKSASDDWKKREIGALWRREGKSQKYLSGKITIGEFGEEKTYQVIVFSNRFKEKDNQPDFRIFEDRPREDVAPSAEPAPESPSSSDGDIPDVLQ
tara:strand:- start:21669 stop:21971 length:303 start_codon:yes stop_codon:yes gene_type:complete